MRENETGYVLLIKSINHFIKTVAHKHLYLDCYMKHLLDVVTCYFGGKSSIKRVCVWGGGGGVDVPTRPYLVTSLTPVQRTLLSPLLN